MPIKSICIISEGYPYGNDPSFSFVEQLVVAFSNNGIKCTVISPQSVSKLVLRRKKTRPLKWVKHTSGLDIDIYQPLFVSLGSQCPDALYKLAYNGYINAAVNTWKRHSIQADVFYGHFWKSGIVAGRMARQFNKPAFVACGESSITFFNKIRKEYFQKDLDHIAGIISVSSENLQKCESLGLAAGKKQIVLPNGIDGTLFRKEDKKQARKKIGADDNDFIVAFLGAFIERKGPNRVAQAISTQNGIKSIFIGKGDLQPECEGIIFKGALKHDDIPTYLNAADVFVLPTLAEGCCNAIIEAMACGLPVISSALPFNDDILNDDYSIRVNPKSIEDISEAIVKLRNDVQLRDKMSRNAQMFASNLDINMRAKRIVDFMESSL